MHPAHRWLRGALLASLLPIVIPPASIAHDEDTKPPSPASGAKPDAASKDASDKTPSSDDASKDDKPPWDVSNPPGPYTDIPIDTDEGSWISLDVSPKGDTLVFDLLGDIYTLPIGGGEARALTSGIPWDMQPRFSPDGRFIAFTSDRGGGDNIWMMKADGSSPTQVTKESYRLLSSPVWTPDSEYIAAHKHFSSTRSLGSGEIWLYHRTGGDGLPLTKKPNDQKNVGEPAFSPDGKYLYYSQDITPGDTFEYNNDPNGEIYAIQRLERETGDIDRFAGGPGGALRPTPSPDGKKLAFIRRVRAKSVLYLQDIASSRETALFDGLDRDLQETWAIHGVYPTMAWTPDSASIVFWSGGKIHRIDVATKKVSDIPFRVKTTRRVSQALRFPVKVAPDRFPVRSLRWVEVSPKGDQVLYQALGRLYVRDLPNGTPRRLTRQNSHFELYPSYSRDGRWVVYTSWDDLELGSIRIVPAKGGEGKVITLEPGHYAEPVFSPDGTKVVYRRGGGGHLVSATWSRDPGLYMLPVKDGGPVKGATPVKVTDKGSHPHFGASSDRVYFFEIQEEEKRALVGIDLDGSDERTYLASENAMDFRLSPDERWVAFREQLNAYVTPFVRTGRSQEVGPKSKGIPVAKVSKDAGDFLEWSGDSRRLYWSLGPELFSRDLKDAFAFLAGAPEKPLAPPEKGIQIGFEAAQEAPSGTIALVGARIVSMKGDEVIDDGTVVVTGNRITAVGPRASIAVPAGAKVVDVKGKTVLPGLIDVHWHGAQATDAVIPQRNWIDYAGLAFGVTTVHDPSNDTNQWFAAAELARTGGILAPRLFSTGTIVYGAKYAEKIEIDGIDEARSVLRRLQALGAFSVKSYNQPRREQRQQVIAAARELGMMVVPEGGSMFMHNLTQIIDGHTGIEHAVPVAPVYRDVIELWSHTGTAYTPTLIVAYGGLFGENYWYGHTRVWENTRLLGFVPRPVLDSRSRRGMTAPDEEFNHIAAARVAKQLVDAGGRVQLGAHGQREGLGAHWELWMLVQGGMTPMQALRAGTLDGARYLGLDGDIGSLEPGKLADLVVLDRNPLENIRDSESVAFTMLNGRLYDARSLDEVAPSARPRGKLFWEVLGR